jgi:hypothetical protein
MNTKELGDKELGTKLRILGNRVPVRTPPRSTELTNFQSKTSSFRNYTSSHGCMVSFLLFWGFGFWESVSWILEGGVVVVT